MVSIDAISTASNIVKKYREAREKHPPMRSPHEGYAILLEELDELWDEIKAWQPMPDGFSERASEFGKPGMPPAADIAYAENMRRMRKEAYHVAAMALAFILETTVP